jgi:hypothetical protein
MRSLISGTNLIVFMLSGVIVSFCAPTEEQEPPAAPLVNPDNFPKFDTHTFQPLPELEDTRLPYFDFEPFDFKLKFNNETRLLHSVWANRSPQEHQILILEDLYLHRTKAIDPQGVVNLVLEGRNPLNSRFGAFDNKAESAGFVLISAHRSIYDLALGGVKPVFSGRRFDLNADEKQVLELESQRQVFFELKFDSNEGQNFQEINETFLGTGASSVFVFLPRSEDTPVAHLKDMSVKNFLHELFHFSSRENGKILVTDPVSSRASRAEITKEGSLFSDWIAFYLRVLWKLSRPDPSKQDLELSFGIINYLETHFRWPWQRFVDDEYAEGVPELFAEQALELLVRYEQSGKYPSAEGENSQIPFKKSVRLLDSILRKESPVGFSLKIKPMRSESMAKQFLKHCKVEPLPTEKTEKIFQSFQSNSSSRRESVRELLKQEWTSTQ